MNIHVALAAFAALTPVPAGETCRVDREAMVRLAPNEFDQDFQGGWRAVDNRGPQCAIAAADLIAYYRSKHPEAPSLLRWHEGQLRAKAGQYDKAILLMDSSRQTLPPNERAQEWRGYVDAWNAYVDATIAFLRNDREALIRARETLNSILRPARKLDTGDFPSWPPNLEVVDGLIACFGRPYSEAYGSQCQPNSAK